MAAGRPKLIEKEGSMRFSVRLLIAGCALGAMVTVATAQERSRDGVTPPVVVKEIKAEYTQAAKDARIQGTVIMDAVVLDDGTVGEVKVTRSLDAVHGLDEAAVNATKQWQFKPGTKDGKPVAVRVEIEMTFTLK